VFNSNISNDVAGVITDNHHTLGITHICADGSYTCVHFITGKSKVYSKNLVYWSRLLPENMFLRCHHSYLVNKEHIMEFCAERGVIVLSGNLSIPVSRRKLKRTIRFLQTSSKSIYTTL
jgi:DNA-binding LytR/AlgR family response regulator